ncbi:MAG: hypothetical protein WC769_05295 [Thermodesulfovibrionales bacterium]|jgi:hypothetical protein
MEDNPNDEKLDRLFAAARKAEPYKKEIEYGFETRLMAKIRDQGERQTPFLLWAWRLIPVFASIVIFLGIWTYSSRYNSMTDLGAISMVGNEETTLLAFLTGE